MPPLATEPRSVVADLIFATTYTYDDRDHAEPWRNALARELNEIINRARWELTRRGNSADIRFATAALSVVKRVADMEEIRFV